MKDNIIKGISMCLLAAFFISYGYFYAGWEQNRTTNEIYTQAMVLK